MIADEKILNAEGQIDTDLLRPLCLDTVQHTYRVMGEVIGKAFHDGNALK